jgi:AraC-like DNA-binding protein
MVRSDPARPRGLMRGKPEGTMRHVRYPPSEDLAFWVEHYWIVEWDLREPFVAQNLPHPSVHLVIDGTHARVMGVVSGRHTRELQGIGRVFGIKLRPGAFHPILGRAVSTMTDKELPLADFFGELEDAILATVNDRERIDIAEASLRECLPPRDVKVDEVNRIMDLILTDREITKVEDLVQRSGVSKRTLQRLFSDYVGVSPKWVINRYRLHEALERAATGESIDWTSLALDLGYFDQAHFIRDFKKLVGKTPTEYVSG